MDGLRIGRDQQVENLLLARGDLMALAAELDLQLLARPLGAAQALVHQEVVDAGAEDVLIVGLDDEIVGAGLQPGQHILRLGERGDEDHRRVLMAGRALQPAT